jgi:hypothetical protein
MGRNVSFAFWKNATPVYKRIIVIAIIFVLAVIFTAVATLTPMDTKTATDRYNQLNQTVTDLKQNNSLLEDIYGNNFFLTMLMFIPFFGPFIGFYAFYNTGVEIKAEGIALKFPPTLGFFTLFLTPVAWLEFISYSTAIAASVWLSARMLQGSFRHELANTAKFISICAVLLLVSAIIESALVYAGL